MLDLSVSMTIGDIIRRDLRTAAVFARHGIDFCCGGRRSLDEACRTKGVDTGLVLGEIEALDAASEDVDMTDWPLDALLDHIVGRHHAYVRRQIPAITAMLERLMTAHGARYPELPRMAATFASLAADITHHMEKEERILFPYIRSLAKAGVDADGALASPFGTVRNPIRMMEEDHQCAAEDLWTLRTLSNGFVPPESACVTWHACFNELAAFERDLHRHVQLEDTVLFPATARLEDELQ